MAAHLWPADLFAKILIASIDLTVEERSSEGFEGKYVNPDYIRQCALEKILEHAVPAGWA